jgi:TolB-like protein
MVPVPQQSTPEPVSMHDRLDSWKGVAAYLKRDVRTVQRWELTRGLPVYRAPGGKRNAIFTLKSELDRWWHASKAELENQPASESEHSGHPSIAVLPFANMSADKENEYFSDGLAEEILNLLAKIPGLKVIARTSAFAFRGKEQDIRTIADTLGVSYVLEGSVRRAGNRIRVAAQLINAADGAHLWSERYDRDLTDIFAIQDEIGQAISGALKVRLAPPRQTVNIEAYRNYLKGQYYRARYTPESLAKTKDYFEQALATEPNYAPAYSVWRHTTAC